MTETGATKPEKNVKMPCVSCGGWPKNHRVLCEHVVTGHDEDGSPDRYDYFQICQCLGCDNVAFRHSATSREDVDDEDNHPETVKIYPSVSRAEAHAVNVNSFPRQVAAIYTETVAAFNAGALTLAGGGLRAIVEGICIDRQVTGRNLKEKIDALVAERLLAQPQAELLHEERYIGNAALHELLAPSKEEIKDGLAIVEGLLRTIYVLPLHAEKLKKKRQQRAGSP